MGWPENQFNFSEEHHQITVFRKQVKDTYTRNFMEPARTSQEFEQQEVLGRGVFDLQQVRKAIDQQTALMMQLAATVQEIKTSEPPKTPSKKKPSPVPRPVRDPMWTSLPTRPRRTAL